MPEKVPYQPMDNSTISPYLCVDGAAKAIAFYTEVFGATEKMRMEQQGKIGHAELVFGDTVVMLADPFPDMGFFPPKDAHQPVQMLVYVPNADDAIAKALARGAKVLRPAKDMFYGDRTGQIADPFGQIWHVSTHIEDVTPEEAKRRLAEECKQPA